MEIPKLHLSLGQVAYTLARGREPSERLLAQIRYLRQLGIPSGQTSVGTGKGYSATYGFDELIELGTALRALAAGMKPKDVAALFESKRGEMRRDWRRIFRSLPEGFLDQPWVKSRGGILPMGEEEVVLRLHDRYSDTPGKFDLLGPNEISKLLPPAHIDDPRPQFFDPVEIYPGEAPRPLIPLKRLMAELVAWALEAPEIRRGRQ